MFWLGFLGGLFIGCAVGIILAACCNAAKYADLQAYYHDLQWHALVAKYDDDDARIADSLN